MKPARENFRPSVPAAPAARFVPVLPARRACTCPPGRRCPDCPAQISILHPTASARPPSKPGSLPVRRQQ